MARSQHSRSPSPMSPRMSPPSPSFSDTSADDNTSIPSEQPDAFGPSASRPGSPSPRETIQIDAVESDDSVTCLWDDCGLVYTHLPTLIQHIHTGEFIFVYVGQVGRHLKGLALKCEHRRVMDVGTLLSAVYFAMSSLYSAHLDFPKYPFAIQAASGCTSYVFEISTKDRGLWMLGDGLVLSIRRSIFILHVWIIESVLLQFNQPPVTLFCVLKISTKDKGLISYLTAHRSYRRP